LIPGPGIRRTFLLAAGLNLLVGALAIVLGSVSVGRGDSSRQAIVPIESDEMLDTLHHRRHADGLVLIVFALSGLTSLALEVVWVRVLSLFLRPTVYGFSVMLATILAGIAFGSYAVAPLLDRRAQWIAVLAGLELAIGVAVVLSFSPLAQMSSLTLALRLVLSRIVPEYLVFPIA